MRQRVETKLAALFVETKQFAKAEAMLEVFFTIFLKMIFFCFEEQKTSQSCFKKNFGQLFYIFFFRKKKNLIKEVKKLDDKLLLTEIHLIEAHLYFDVNNIPKAKAALTSSKTKANAIHCPPLLQAEIDMRSGVICARDNDFGNFFYLFIGFFKKI